MTWNLSAIFLGSCARPRLLSLTLVLSVGFLGLSCGHKEEVIVATAKPVSAPAIDADPPALLPGGAVALALLHYPEVFASPLGAKLSGIIKKELPVPESAGFVPERDLEWLHLGVYSMQGADFVGVALGRFDPARIAAAADGVQQTPRGLPLTKTDYAGRTLYTAGTIGFCVLTERTALVGNNTGIRRALDRLNEGRVKRNLPAWAEPLFKNVQAPLVAAADLRENPVLDGAKKTLAFLNNVETATLVGTFQEPGVNVAGTLSYPDDAQAQAGAERVHDLARRLPTYGLLLMAMGFPQPVRRLEAAPQGKDVSVSLALDAAGLSQLLDRAQQFLGANPGQGTSIAATSP